MGITSYIYYTFSRPLFLFLSQTISHSHFIVVSLPSFLKCRPSTFYAHIYVCIYFSFLSFRLDSRSSVLPIYLSVCVFLPSYSPILLFSYSPFYISIHHVCFPICFLARLSACFLPFLYTSTFPSSLLLFTLYINAPTPNFYTSSYLHMYHVHLIVYIIYI